MSLWGKRRVDVLSRWEEPGVTVGGSSVTNRRCWPVGVQSHHGGLLLVDLGAEEAPSQAAFRFRLEDGHLARKELILLFIGPSIPAV